MLDGIDFAILIWLIIAALSGVGEMLSGTLFLLPFVGGAIVAAVLAAVGVDTVWVLAVFAVISLGSLVALVRLALPSKTLPSSVRAGGGRYIDALGLVTTEVERGTAGRVRVESESWRAHSLTDEPIAAGVRVRVVDIRGNALVVQPVSTETDSR
jgi:membrane protein implicated in regulation of membrane protease activity